MEFSFKLYDFLQMLEENPQYMVIWGAFGVPALMLVLALPFVIMSKIGFKKGSQAIANVVYLTLFATWILGFITMMIMMFTEVSGIRMFMVWSLMFITYLAFVLFNYNGLMKGVGNLSKKKTP